MILVSESVVSSTILGLFSITSFSSNLRERGKLCELSLISMGVNIRRNQVHYFWVSILVVSRGHGP